jgi:hypothetical protein
MNETGSSSAQGGYTLQSPVDCHPAAQSVKLDPRPSPPAPQIFCNVEGISWLDDDRFIISSDKAKSTQPYRCTHHDQSIHIFALPE